MTHVHASAVEILIVAIALAGAVVATRLSRGAGIPALVLFLGLGFLLGSDGLGLVSFSNPELTQLAATIALVVILFEGGLQSPWSSVRPVAGMATRLATIGVVITALVVGLVAHEVLPLDWTTALLLGAVVGSTDAAAVFASLRNRRIPPRLVATLEAESGLNDPAAVLITVLLLGNITGDGPTSIVGVGLMLVLQVVAGLFVGVLTVLAMRPVMRRMMVDEHLLALLLLGGALLCYSTATLAGGSGFLAVYVAGLGLGESHIPHRRSVLDVHTGLAWLMQITMFIVLGLFAFPSQLRGSVTESITICFVLLFAARPLAVLAVSYRSGFSWRELVFIAWTGLRGAVPIVLATFPLSAGIDDAQLVFNVVLFVVVASAIAQGMTAAPLARALGIARSGQRRPVASLELATMLEANARLLQVEIPHGAQVVEQTLAALSLPRGTAVSAIVRGERIVIPTGRTAIRAGDVLYLLVERGRESEALHLLGQDDAGT